MNVPQFLKDYGELISITLMPFIIFYVGKKFQDREAKNKAKLDLFLRIMANRKKYPPSMEMADCLNQIDVVFQENQKIRGAWRAYFDALHLDSQHNMNSNSFFLDLLSEIANELKYLNLKQTELDRFYTPQYHIDSTKTTEEFLSEFLRVLNASKNIAEAYSPEEYQKHMTDLKS